MINDNIEDVSDNEEVSATVNPRDEYLKQLQVRRAKELADDGVVDGLDEEDLSGGNEDESSDHNEEEQDESVVEDIPKVQKHKIKVNGKELELSYEELVERAQKVEAADEYLRTAKELTDNARFNQPSQKDVDEKVEEDDLELVRAIQMGSEEEAAAAIRKIRQAKEPSFSKEELLAEVEERAKVTAAAQKFAEDFSDVFNDPILRNLAFEEDARLMSTGDRRPYDVRYAEIGNNIRKWRNSLNQTNTVDEKIQRKINTPSIPKAAGRQKLEDDDNREESHQEVLARMKKARGQLN